MLKSELLNLLNDVEENADIDEQLMQLDVFKNANTLDKFKSLITTDKEFKSFMDSEKDKHSAKALETWKSNNLENLLNEKIKELYPDETEESKEMKKLKMELENLKREKELESLKTLALKTATEKQLPADVVKFFIGENEESTIENLNNFEKVFNGALETKVKERIKDTYVPRGDGGNQGSTSYDNLLKNVDNMTADEVASVFDDIK